MLQQHFIVRDVPRCFSWFQEHYRGFKGVSGEFPEISGLFQEVSRDPSGVPGSFMVTPWGFRIVSGVFQGILCGFRDVSGYSSKF